MSRKNTVAIIQARMGSSRLPGKVMKPFGRRSMLSYLVDRIRAAREVNFIIVATTTAGRDDVIVDESLRIGAAVFRGSETDVLDRYLKAARISQAEIVVRVTADNPFTDPESIDRTVACIRRGSDYAIETDMPIGTTGEAVSLNALEFMDRAAGTDLWREHVTLFAKENPHAFNCAFLKAPWPVARPDLSFTVDRLDEYEYVRGLSQKFAGPNFALKNLISAADMVAGAFHDDSGQKN